MTPSATHSSEPHQGEEASGGSDDDLLLMRRRRHKVAGSNEGLNLTAMMDIFTIILVFMIKQYEAAPQNITLNEDLTPPKSTTEQEMVPGVALTISKTSILLDNKLVIQLVPGTPVTDAEWTVVAKALADRRDTITAISDRGGAKFTGDVMVIADGDVPYEILSTALLQAGNERYNTYRLILQAGGKN
jgi:biopolymer transport protein ExbD